MIFRIFAALVAGFAVSFSYGDVTVEDFDGGSTSQTTLGANCGTLAHTGYWYGFTDTTEKPIPGTTRITPDVCAVDKMFTAATVAGGTNGTKCLHVTFTNGGTGFAFPFGAVGFHINTNQRTTIDLSAMTSITLMAKGTGSMRLHFVTSKVNSFPAGENWGEMGTDFTLTSAWKKYTITKTDIVPQPGSPQAAANLTWAQCSDKVLQLHFQTAPSFQLAGTIDFWMDDVVMQGISGEPFGATIPVRFNATKRQANRDISVTCRKGVLSCSLPSEQNISISLFGLNGELVNNVYKGTTRAVSIPVQIRGGMYVCKIESAQGISTVPIMINR